MLKTIFSGCAVAALLSSPALAVPVTVSAGTSGSVSGQSLFGGSNAGDFAADLRVGPAIAQIYASAEASSGTVSSSVNTSFDAAYDNSVGLSSAASTQIALKGNAAASFNTLFGAGFEAGVGTNLLGFGDTELIGANYTLNASSSSTLTSSTAGTDSTAFARVGTPTIPGISIGGGVSGNATQSSTLNLTNVTGRLVAQNTTTGSIISSVFSFATPNFGNFDFDLSEVGVWNLSITDVGVGNSFKSTFGVSVSGDVGASLGFNCGNPTTDDDNGLGCIADGGVEIESSPLNLANIDGFALLYRGFQNKSLGSISVFNDIASEVPVPGALPLMVSALAAGGLMRRRKAK